MDDIPRRQRSKMGYIPRRQKLKMDDIPRRQSLKMDDIPRRQKLKMDDIPSSIFLCSTIRGPVHPTTIPLKITLLRRRGAW
jgi:hypothetical protein